MSSYKNLQFMVLPDSKAIKVFELKSYDKETNTGTVNCYKNKEDLFNKKDVDTLEVENWY